MRKSFKSKKGVSPVITTIILVAVAITMPVAASYWMSDIASQSTINCITYGFGSGDPNNTIAVKFKNTRTATLNITEVRVNDEPKNFSITGEKSVLKLGEESLIMIYNAGWVSEETYRVTILISSGSSFTKETVAP